MTTSALTPAAEPHADGFGHRFWRVALASVLVSIALLVLKSGLESAVVHDLSAYDDQASTDRGALTVVLEVVWLLVTGGVLAALLVRSWLPDSDTGTRLRLIPLSAMLALSAGLGGMGVPPGEAIGFGLLPLLAVAYFLPRLPREPPHRPRPVGVAALLLVLAVPPAAANALAGMDGAAVGCGSVPCVVGADGRTELAIGMSNQGRLSIEVTAVSPIGLPDGARQVELRESSFDGGRGVPVSLPLVMPPKDQLFLDATVVVPGSACRGDVLAQGAEIRYRVAGLERRTRIEPVGMWRRGLDCRIKP